jgi:hypothetical protein
MPAGGKSDTLWWLAVGATAAVGLLLRVLAARGGVWTDEAWSMIYAEQARDAAGVFLRINHDNNHHLNTLWLQAIGMGAPPWLARLPAILAGTACVVIAAMIAGRKSRSAGIVAAALFAVSPAMVTFGSEARGYALMLLAALTMLLVIISAIERGWTSATPWWLALVALLGMFSHLTMAAPVALITLWVYLERRGAAGSTEALRTTARLMGPAVIATIAIVAFVFAAALVSPTGMRIGGYVPFSWGDYGAALDHLTGSATGLAAIPWWARLPPIAAAAVAVVIRPPLWLGARGRLYGILILGMPVAVAVLSVGNASHVRYYLISLAGLYLLIAAVDGHALTKRGTIRATALAVLLLFVALSLLGDAQLMRLQRGHPERPLSDVASLSPSGARVAVNPRYEAIMTVAARRAGYPLRLVKNCEQLEFVLAPRPVAPVVPATVTYCGRGMRLLDSSTASPLTGDAWALYRAETLPSRRPPVSGPPPGARNRRLSGRAGVAQG